MIRDIFNRDAVIAVLIMLAVAVALIVGASLTGNTEALADCKATRSSDVCEFTIR